MSEIGKALGVGNTLVWGGKTLEIAPFTWKLRARFQSWLNDQAWAKVEATRGSVDPVTYKERHAAMTALIGADHFAAGNAGFQSALASYEGQAYELFLRVSQNHPEFTPELAEALYEERFDDVMARLSHQDADPNPQTAKGTTAQSPSPLSVPPSLTPA